MDKLVIANIADRPTRAAASVFGVAIGIASSLALGRVFSSVVEGVGAADPITLGVVGVVLIVVSALASYLPARRATKVDPVIALRNQ